MALMTSLRYTGQQRNADKSPGENQPKRRCLFEIMYRFVHIMLLGDFHS